MVAGSTPLKYFSSNTRPNLCNPFIEFVDIATHPAEAVSAEGWARAVVVWRLAVVSVAKVRTAPVGRVVRGAAVTRAAARAKQTSPAAELCGH